MASLEEDDKGDNDDDYEGIEGEDPSVELNLIDKLLHQQHTEIPTQYHTDDNRRQGDNGYTAQEETLQFAH